MGIEKELNLKTPADSLKSKWVFTDSEITDFSADTLLAALINRAASFCVLYPDPDYFQLMNEHWFKRWEPAFTKTSTFWTAHTRKLCGHRDFLP